MKDFKQHILEKLKVSSKHTIVKSNTCLVRLDLFIPWLYEYRYHALDDLDAIDLNHPDAPFKSELKKYFSDNEQKLFNFFYDNAYGDNNIIEVESIEEYPGAWEFEFTIDNITFKTNKKFRWPLNVWKTKYPSDNSVDFIINESNIDEKLKISSNKSNIFVDGNLVECTFTDFLDWYFGKDGVPISESDFKMFGILNNKELQKRFRKNYLLLYHFYLDNKYTDIVVYVYQYTRSTFAYRFDVKDVEGFYFECVDDFREYVNIK